jgi:hypothetical protein
MARKSKIPWTTIAIVAIVAAVVYFVVVPALATSMESCPGSQVYCPGVGCVSGVDKCVPGARGGPSKIFSKETFTIPRPKPWETNWENTIKPAFGSFPGTGVKSIPPDYGKESFVSKTCPDGTRSDGPCLMEFPSF